MDITSISLDDLYGHIQQMSARNNRYHCSICGRFVPFPTVRERGSITGETYAEGDCKTHGRVEVNWGEL